MSDSRLPRSLTSVRGPIPDAISLGAVEGLGDWGLASREGFEKGFVPADVLAGMSLFLLSHQPRRQRADGDRPEGVVAGGVWVREQYTIHRPVRREQTLVVSGESARRFSRKSRRYGVTTSRTCDEAGELLVSNCTTGLLRYRKEAGLADAEEGRPENDIEILGPDAAFAAENPARETLARLREGDRFEGERCVVSLAMMRLRDAKRDANPIHTDPEVAKREGLAAPIAGGSQVLSFLNEALLRTWGAESLLYGAHFDLRWLGQTRAGATVLPEAVVDRVTNQLVKLSLVVRADDRVAMVGTLQIPLAG